MGWSTLINLDKKFFSEKEKVLAVNGCVSASIFLFDSGVQGLRICNNFGNVVFLPYQGQQIWSCNFLEHDLTMKSIFSEPVATREFLDTYGGFLYHCGATAMGVPSERDSHKLHGELPNAPYQKAYIVIGQDEKGLYIGLGGQYNHRVAFNHNYCAEPLVKVYENSTVINVSMTITNYKNTDMELMYMMHVNFKPVDNSKLIYSAHCNPKDVKVHENKSSNVEEGSNVAKCSEFIKSLAASPVLHNVLKPGLPYDPEILFTINYKVDEMGNAYSMQVQPDGYASYISHKPSELNYGIRWIARTNNEDALGLVLPSTAEHKGYTTEKEKGNIRILHAGEKVTFNVEAGLLNPSEAENIKNKIEGIMNIK